MAEAFSRRLGRGVTLEETGLGPPGAPHSVLSAATDASTIERSAAHLLELCAADADPSRRAALRDLVYSVAASRAATGIGSGAAGDERPAGRSQRAHAGAP